tara:strand:- start:569 stop:790 length:222 start_codon:yes stop_codon:yes gene_type:complete
VPPKLVQVHWVDVAEISDWSTDVENPEFFSIGWLISDDDSPFVKLSTTRALDDDAYSSILSIPRGCVLSLSTI